MDKLIPEKKEFTFRCTIMSLLREKNTWRQYSFSTDDDIPTTSPVIKMHNLETKTKKRFGKISTFGVELQSGVEYVIKAYTKQNIWNNVVYTNLEANEIYPVLDEQGQKDFLAAITTKERYENIISVYPDFVDRVINNLPIDYKKIRGVGEKTLNKLKDKINLDYWKADIMSWLMPLGITEKMIQKLMGKYKSPLVLKEKLKQNPYILTQIHGLGFFRVDEIVLKLFPEKKVSPERLIAFLEYFLMYRAYNNGDTVVMTYDLHNAVNKTMPECIDIFMDYIERVDSILKFADSSTVGLKYFYNLEKEIFDILHSLNNAKTDICVTNENYIEDIERVTKIKLTEEQLAIVEEVKNNNFIIITGNAGTGKTTVIRAILSAFDNVGTALCSLSAKAANRIKEVTGVPAYTIHRLLKYDGKKFHYDKYNPLPHRLIIVDEASMLEIGLWKSLLDAIEPGCKLIAVGDDGQLPPIGAGNIFGDLLESDFVICRLNKIHRQALKSGIIVDANMIREGVNPFNN